MSKKACSDCGAPFVASDCTPGYATLQNRRRVCYLCCDKRQREDFKDRSEPFFAYLAGDKITTWTGGHLMNVTRSRPCRLTRLSFTHEKRGYRSIHAVDVHGGHWSGRGSDGIAIKLHPVKG